MIKKMLELCVREKVNEATEIMQHLYKMGYSPEDILSNMFRVCKSANIPEYLKMEYIKVRTHLFTSYFSFRYIR